MLILKRKRLAKEKWDESIDEMKDADRIIERILNLEGVPNMQRLSPIRVSEDPIEQHRLDLEMELAAAERYNDAIGLARDTGENGTRELLECHLSSEEESVDWLESQLYLDDKLSTKNDLCRADGW